MFILLISFNTFMLVYKNLNKPEGPNVILITIDTLRADHLGSYGYERDTSPNIDKLAEEGVLFENAFSQAPWTLPSMVSIHTSLYPSEHGVVRHDIKLHDKFLTIAEFLKNNFYKTIGIISQPFVSSLYGFSQGYDIFDEEYITGAKKTSSEHLTERAIEYISDNQDNKFFLWIHYFDPHAIYLHHEDYNYGKNYLGNLPANLSLKFLKPNRDSLNTEDIEYIKDIYDEEISYTDKHIGELIDSINNLGLSNDTVIIITADHGEAFMERNDFGHGRTLYQELIHVPLIIYNPLDTSTIGKRVTNNVEVRYIAKTISELTNLNNSYIEGYNLLDIDHENSSDGILYSEQPKYHLKAVLVNDWKLISNSKDNIFELYNLKEDSNELSNQFTSNREDITQVRDILTAKLLDLNNLKTTEIKKIKLTKEDIKKLKALGYLQ